MYLRWNNDLCVRPISFFLSGQSHITITNPDNETYLESEISFQ